MSAGADGPQKAPTGGAQDLPRFAELEDGRTDLVSEGHYDMQVDSWTPQGATTIERRVIGPLLGPWGLTGGQFDDQPGTDMVGPTRGGYWFRVGGWYNRDAKPVYPDFEDRSYISHETSAAAGDIDGDGHTDLVMLTPSTASLQVWYGRATGPSPAPGHTIDLSSLPNAAELGPGLAVGDVNGDGWAEIAVGAAKATVSGHSEAGAVMVIPGSANGPAVKHAQIITQDGVGTTGGGTSVPDPIREQSRPGDHFGQAITIIDVTGDGRGEVIVGTPAKNGGSGMLAVLHGSATGVSATTAQAVHPSSYGLNSTQANFGGFLLK